MKKLFILLLLVLFVPILFLHFKTDANVYAYIGKVIFNGGVPYVDAWDHKGISLYLINAIGYGIFGFKSFLGIRILELILIIYAFTKFFTYTKRKYSALIAMIAGLFGFFTFKYFLDGGNLTEEYGAIFSLLSVLLLLKKETRTIDYAMVGAFFIINFTIRANLISLWVALFLVYIIQLLLKEKSIKTILLSFLKMGYGAIAISIVLLTYLWTTNSFDAFIDAAFTFNFSYSDSTPASTFQAIIVSMKRYHLSMILIVGFIFSLIRFLKDRSRFLELLLILWIPIELYFSNISNRMYAHYYLIWMPLILFSMTIILSEIKERLKLTNVRMVIGSLLLFVACYYVPSYMTMRDWKKVISSRGETEKEMIVSHIKKEYSESSLLVWGNGSYIYNKLDKISSITYFYQSIFKLDTKLTRDKIKDFTSQVKENKPELIIDISTGGFINLDRSNSNKVDENQKANLKEFLDFVNKEYKLKEEKFGLTFYELKENE